MVGITITCTTLCSEFKVVLIFPAHFPVTKHRCTQSLKRAVYINCNPCTKDVSFIVFNNNTETFSFVYKVQIVALV